MKIRVLSVFEGVVYHCWTNDASNPGSFYGGWITSKVVGPFKGAPGTLGW